MTKPPTLQAVNPETPGNAPLDPFDLGNLRLSQSFTEIGVKKLLTTVPVRKPGPQDWVRVHSSPEFKADFPVIELKTEREEYVVTAGVAPVLVGEYVPKTLLTAITRQGTVFLWPIRLPSSDGKDLDWWRSARDAAARARDKWVRIRPNMEAGAYDLYLAEADLPEPEWPELTFQELVKIAFRDHLVDRIDHPVIKRLRGQV
jgi:hypothetical protein